MNCGITGSGKGDEDKQPSISSLINWSLDDDFVSWADNALNRVSGFFNEPMQNSLNTALKNLTSPPSQAVSYGVPSVRQYDACMSKSGRSLWTEDGFWRCLFKGESIPSNLKHEFKDYTGFLEYQRDLLKKQEEQRRLALEQVQRPKEPAQSTMSNWSSYDQLSLDNGSRDTFPGSDRPRLISEKEAEGKNIIRQSEKTEAVTLDDGSLQSRTELVKYFDDGTAFVKRSNSTDQGTAASKSWFWK